MTFQDRVLSMLASLESRVEVLTKHKEKLRQEVAIYKTALSARVMATHEAPRVEVPKLHMFSGQQDAMAVAESLMDYKESMSSNDEGSRVSHNSSGGEEVFPRGSEDDCSTDGGEEVPRSTARHEKGKVSYTRKDKGKRKKRESTPKLKCFLCDGLHLTKFAYNNSYQASIQMTPYEALYGRLCRSPVCWMEVGERPSTGPDLIRDTSEKVDWIQKPKPLS